MLFSIIRFRIQSIESNSFINFSQTITFVTKTHQGKFCHRVTTSTMTISIDICKPVNIHISNLMNDVNDMHTFSDKLCFFYIQIFDECDYLPSPIPSSSVNQCFLVLLLAHTSNCLLYTHDHSRHSTRNHS